MKLPLENLVLGTLWDDTSCALVADHEMDQGYELLKQHLGRDTYPGELYAAAAQQLNVDRIVAVRVAPGLQLNSLLEPVGPGELQAKGLLPAETREDLEQNDFKILDP